MPDGKRGPCLIVLGCVQHSCDDTLDTHLDTQEK